MTHQVLGPSGFSFSIDLPEGTYFLLRGDLFGTVGADPDGDYDDFVAAAIPVAPIPSLNEWGMIIFSLLIASFAIWYMRKKAYGVRIAYGIL
jgi:hypothetical protein